MENNIPRLLRDWREPGAKFVVVRDNDNADCLVLKGKLRQLCHQGRRADTLIRIVCQELEAWYLSEPRALADAYEDENSKTSEEGHATVIRNHAQSPLRISKS